MTTSDQRLNLYPSKILGLQDLSTYLADILRTQHRQLRKDVYGIVGAVLEPSASPATFSFASSQLTLAATRAAITGDGYRLLLDHTDASFQAIPFANVGATTYYVRAQSTEIPAALETAADGLARVARWEEAVGVLGNPTGVTVTGGGTTLTLNISGLVAPGWTAAGSRPVTVWMGSPQTAGADGIYTGTASYNGSSGNIEVVIPHLMGQTAPITSAGAYNVVVHGPTINTAPTTLQSAVLLGTVASGVFSSSGQLVLADWSATVADFYVEHDASGAHTQINGETLTLSGSTGTKLQSTSVDVGDNANPHYEALNHAAVELFRIYTINGGVLEFPRADLGGAILDVRDDTGSVSTVDLLITNGADPADDCRLVIDGIIRRNPGKAAAWKLQSDNALDDTLILENAGAGRAHLQILDGDLALTTGKATVSNVGLELQGGSSRVRYLTPRTRTITIPAFLDVTPRSGTPNFLDAATPPNIRPTATGGTSRFTIRLDHWLDAEAEGMVLDSFSAMHLYADGAATLQAVLYRAINNGSSARVAISTLTASAVSGAWKTTGMSASGLAHTIDTESSYWIELVFTYSTAALAELGISHLTLGLTQEYL